MIQTLKGVKITPKGSKNRFVAQGWPNSYAFGGWIYSASTSIGFNSSPTEIKMSVVLETSTFNQRAALFDITENDLICNAGNGFLSEESLYDIELEGVIFKDFILYEYDFSIEVNQKILNVTFKDYSIILDKIYVGLFKKQGYEQSFNHSSNSKAKFPIVCQDCTYNAFNGITGIGSADRKIDFASYIGTNEKIYDNFTTYYYQSGKNAYDYWKDLIETIENPLENSNNGKFDLNGGYLIIGTESVAEENCNSAPNITYSFIELISSLRKGGLSFIGDFPKPYNENSEIMDNINGYYKASYIGTLREVLQNWCSDLGYDFYFSGRAIVGINLKKPIDISKITSVADPTTEFGQSFAINGPGNSAILSFKTSSSLNNTFKQSIIVENSHPITETTNQKTIKRYVKILPLHPTSLNSYNRLPQSDYTINGGIQIQRARYEIDFFNDSQTERAEKHQFFLLDGRNYADLDASIALSKYNDILRDIFVAQRALDPTVVSLDGVPNNTFDPLGNYNCRANFRALGMDPIVEINDAQAKSDILYDFLQNGEKNGVSNLNTDSQYYRVFLGYFNEDLKNDIVNWEKKAADAMYKYGVVTNGNLKSVPFVTPDTFLDISPEAGFYENGLWFNTIKNTFTPPADRYIDHTSAPFADVLLYYSLVNDTIVSPRIRIPSKLWIATLDNDWGTTVEDFNSQLSVNLSNPCEEKYSLADTVSSISSRVQDNRQAQDWKLEYFRPFASPNLERVKDIVQKYNLGGAIDNIVTTYMDSSLRNKQECKKIHVLVIPDTENHPNLNVFFSRSSQRNRVNQVVLQKFNQKVYNIEYEKTKQKPSSICSFNLAQQMCKNALRGEIYKKDDPNTLLEIPSAPPDPIPPGGSIDYFPQEYTPLERVNCATFEDGENNFIDGFSDETLRSKNSRSLSIVIEKNPPQLNNADRIGGFRDRNGDYYYADLGAGNLQISSRTSVLEIVYPIQCETFGDETRANYLGVLSTQVETDIRMPAINNIYGKPINSKNNNVSSFKIINQTTDSDLNPHLNPLNNQVTTFMTVITGGGGKSVISTPENYYNFVKDLNNYSLESPMKMIEMELAGSPNEFGPFKTCINPSSGLNQFSISVTDNGVRTTLSFSDRPKKLPKQEAILNKIGPRIKGIYS